MEREGRGKKEGRNCRSRLINASNSDSSVESYRVLTSRRLATPDETKSEDDEASSSYFAVIIIEILAF